MPFFKATKSTSFVGFKRKAGGGDPDFFGGAMETTWGWGTNDGGISTNKLITDGSTTNEINSPSQASYAADHKFKTIILGNGDQNAFGIKANSPPDDGGTLWAWGGNGNGQ